jgi:RNA polymerase sigma-70 factor (ECF subfamily)
MAELYEPVAAGTVVAAQAAAVGATSAPLRRNAGAGGETNVLRYSRVVAVPTARPALVRLGYVNEAEAELIRGCVAGDHGAWEGFIHRYQSRVYNVAYHMTQDTERASDLTQEAFIQILRSLSRFRGEASLSTWVHGLTMRVCLHHLRRERRSHAESWEELAPGRPEPAGAEGRPYEEVARDQIRRHVHAAIAELPLKFRSVMVLNGLGGMTYEETAQALGVPVNTVKTRVFRAKARLRQSLKHLVGIDEHDV